MDRLSVSMTVIYTVLSLFGIVGNFLVILVVVKVKSMRTATNCYLLSLAISDSLFFLSALPTEIHDEFYPTRYDFGQIGCMMQIFVTYLSMNTSSLSVAAFSVERFIGICYPMKAMYSCTVRRAVIIVTCIWVFSIIYNSPWLYIATIKERQINHTNTTTSTLVTRCDFKYSRTSLTYKAMYVGDIMVFYLIPMLLYVFLYTRIAKSLRNRVPSVRNSQRNTHKLKKEPRLSMHFNNTDAAKCIDHTTPNSLLSSSRSRRSSSARENSSVSDHLRVSDLSKMKRRSAHSRTSVHDTSASAKEKNASSQIVKMLAVVTLLFGVLWMPYKGMVLYNSFAPTPWVEDWFLLMAKTFVFVNAAINPLLYNVMSIKFRTAFCKLLLGRRRSLELAKTL